MCDDVRNMNEPPLRVIFCTNGGLPGSLVMRHLLASTRVTITGVVLSSRLLSPRYGFLRGAIEYWRRCGARYTLYLWCATALADFLYGWAGTATASLAKRHNIPVLATRDLNQADGQAFFVRVAPDLLVSAFFNQRIGEHVASAPRLGAINIHPSLLPQCRGVDPAFYGALRGLPEQGVTLHRISPAFDEGAILASEAVTAMAGASVLWTTATLYDRGGELLVNHIDDIARGTPGTLQPAGGNCDSWPTRQQVSALCEKGGKLVAMRDLLQLIRGRRPGEAA